MSGFNVGHLKIPGVCDYSLEISDDETFKAAMKKINAELRFKHKIFDPVWETRRIGDGKPVSIDKPRAKKAAKPKPAPAPTPVPEATEQKSNGRPARPAMPKPKAAPKPAPAPEVVLEREREGSVQGTIDIAAARRLARS